MPSLQGFCRMPLCRVPLHMGLRPVRIAWDLRANWERASPDTRPRPARTSHPPTRTHSTPATPSRAAHGNPRIEPPPAATPLRELLTLLLRDPAPNQPAPIANLGRLKLGMADRIPRPLDFGASAWALAGASRTLRPPSRPGIGAAVGSHPYLLPHPAIPRRIRRSLRSRAERRDIESPSSTIRRSASGGARVVRRSGSRGRQSGEPSCEINPRSDASSQSEASREWAWLRRCAAATTS